MMYLCRLKIICIIHHACVWRQVLAAWVGAKAGHLEQWARTAFLMCLHDSFGGACFKKQEKKQL
jgi:hypothetical protein